MILLLIAGNTTFAEEKKKSNEITVGFVKNTAEKDIAAFEKKFNLTVVKKFKRICAIRYKVADGKESSKTISKVQQEKIVRYAERNGKVAQK